jgi:hypothetical protein
MEFLHSQTTLQVLEKEVEENGGKQYGWDR